MEDDNVLSQALRWIDRHMEDDPDPDVQALVELIRSWRSAELMGRTISVNFVSFTDGLNRTRYS